MYIINTFMNVIDNFLDKKEFQQIQDICLGANFPWFCNSNIVRPENKDEFLNFYNYQFTHTLYRDYSPCSNYFNDICDPLFFKINPASIMRVKANLIPRADKNVIHEYHEDITNFKGKTAIYYVNTNDGKTYFKDHQSVEAVENRLVIFDSNLLHTGSTCTDQRTRVVLNLNYFEWNN
jgi:hypothetical protein